MANAWTDEEIVLAKELAQQPESSAAIIAAQLGRSKSAVIGFFARNNIPLPNAGRDRKTSVKDDSIKRKPTVRKKSKSKQRRTVYKRVHKPKLLSKTNNLEKPNVEPMFFKDLPRDRSRCSYPVNGENDQPGPYMLVCGAPVHKKNSNSLAGSYCSYHLEKSRPDE